MLAPATSALHSAQAPGQQRNSLSSCTTRSRREEWQSGETPPQEGVPSSAFAVETVQPFECFTDLESSGFAKANCNYAAVVSASELPSSSCERISRNVEISSSRET